MLTLKCQFDQRLNANVDEKGYKSLQETSSRTLLNVSALIY